MPRVVVVLPLTPLQTGDRFAVADWPLHITVLAPFLTDATPPVLRAALNEVCARPALTVTAGADALFGRRHDLPVTIVNDSAPLTALHDAVAAALLPFAVNPAEPAFTGTEFHAHVTVKNHRRVHARDVLLLTQLALVDMASRASAHGRTVLATLHLRGPALD